MQDARREAIKKALASKPFVSIKELAAMFPDVSEMTIRRDIEYFESINEAIKVRGGARSMKFISGLSYQTNLTQKTITAYSSN